MASDVEMIDLEVNMAIRGVGSSNGSLLSSDQGQFRDIAVSLAGRAGICW